MRKKLLAAAIAVVGLGTTVGVATAPTALAARPEYFCSFTYQGHPYLFAVDSHRTADALEDTYGASCTGPHVQ